MGKSRNTPADVARTLRREAGFGCAKCGHPYVQYHHIVEWKDEQHFRPEDMVALCPTHHVSVAKYQVDRQREIKSKPYNIANGIHSGALDYDKRDLVFDVGGTRYINVGTFLRFKDRPIISCRIDEGQAKCSLNLYDKNDQLILEVKDNEVVFSPNNIWDYEYKNNHAVVRTAAREIALEMDFREETATIRGSFWAGGNSIKLDRHKTVLPGDNMLFGGVIEGGEVGIQID